MFIGIRLSLVEHSPDKGKVGGSNPPMPIKQVEWIKVIAFGAGSGGSIPSSPDIKRGIV